MYIIRKNNDNGIETQMTDQTLQFLSVVLQATEILTLPWHIRGVQMSFHDQE